VVLAFLVATAFLLWGSNDRPILELDVAFSSNACCSWQVWVNGTDLRDITVLPVVQGTERTYDVPLMTNHVSYLRMPIGQVDGMTMTLRDIRVTRGSHTVAHIDPSQLALTTSYVRNRRIGDDVELTSTYAQPFVAAPVSLDTGEGSFQMFVARVESNPLRGVVALMLIGVVAAVAVAVRNRRQAAWFAGIVVTILLIRALPWLSHRLGVRDSVRNAVGFASYQGLWKRREQLVVDAAAVLAVLVPAVVCASTRQVARLRASAPAEGASRTRPLLATAVVAAPVVVLGLAYAPNLRALVGGRPQYVPSWDSNNFVFWSYLIQKLHLVPMRDFFWPYGFQSLFQARAPWGLLLSYVVSLAFWSFVAVGSYLSLARFFAGRQLVTRYVLLAAFWVSVTLAGYWPFTVRYAGAVAAVLLFAGMRPLEPLVSPRRLVFMVGLTAVILLEPAQAIYAAPAIAFLCLAELAFSVELRPRSIATWASTTAITLGVPTAAAAAVYAATGELHRTLRYYEELPAVGAQAALPGRVDSWVTSPSGLQSFLFWSVPLALCVGVYGLVTARDRTRDSSPIVIALALVAFMIMQKQTLRPGIESQIWLPVVFALAFWSVADSRLDVVRRSAVLGAAAAAAFSLVLVSGGYRAGVRNVIHGPQRVARSAGALLHRRAELAATADRSFTPAAFERFYAYKPVVAALKRVPAVRRGRPLWILGDDSPITMMLGLRWPYYYNDLYDAAPLDAQRVVLGRLRAVPPSRVVWNFSTQAMVFDTVPEVVRVPLLFQWAVANLVPEKTVGTFAILRPREAADAVPLAWWRRRIGTTTNLGHIPSVAQLPPLQCVGTSPSCGTYLVVDFPPGAVVPQAIEVPVTVAGVRFSVEFEPSAGVRRYVVPLDRLWFWLPGRQVVRGVDTHTVPSASVDVIRRLVDRDALY